MKNVESSKKEPVLGLKVLNILVDFFAASLLMKKVFIEF